MLTNLKQTIELINTGKPLHIAGDERLLSALPRGNWLGGTTPYFITEDGGLLTEELLLVDEFPVADGFRFSVYGEASIHSIAEEADDNGFTILILPFGSAILERYAKDAAGIDGIFLKNIVGWVSGFNLGQAGAAAKTFLGTSSESFVDKAVALHLRLPASRLATIGIINIFSADEASPAIEFPESSFAATQCLVDGKPANLADYIAARGIDTKLPLVANYGGSGINISIKQIKGDTVSFYAPVFPAMQYRFAKPVGEYAGEFDAQIKGFRSATPAFSCNCILNYLYGALEGKSTKPFAGPVTFGEIAYQLVNQTLVYVSVG